jgi:hypothetical protein
MIKNCMTCAHRKGSGFAYSKCMVTGFYCETERKHASTRGCDVNFSRWEPKVSLTTRIINIFKAKE